MTDTAREAGARESARIQAILTSEEAQGREQLARHLAFETHVTAGEAIETLSASARHPDGLGSAGPDYLARFLQPERPASARGHDDAVTGLAAAVTRQLAAIGKKPLDR